MWHHVTPAAWQARLLLWAKRSSEGFSAAAYDGAAGCGERTFGSKAVSSSRFREGLLPEPRTASAEPGVPWIALRAQLSVLSCCRYPASVTLHLEMEKTRR